MHSVVETRLWGTAELNIEFRNVEVAETSARAGLVEVDGQ
jgi:hypothetical protein